MRPRFVEASLPGAGGEVALSEGSVNSVTNRPRRSRPGHSQSIRIDRDLKCGSQCESFFLVFARYRRDARGGREATFPRSFAAKPTAAQVGCSNNGKLSLRQLHELYSVVEP